MYNAVPFEAQLNGLESRVRELETENARLREALEYYANNENYIRGYYACNVECDSGDIARDALAACAEGSQNANVLHT